MSGKFQRNRNQPAFDAAIAATAAAAAAAADPDAAAAAAAASAPPAAAGGHQQGYNRQGRHGQYVPSPGKVAPETQASQDAQLHKASAIRKILCDHGILLPEGAICYNTADLIELLRPVLTAAPPKQIAEWASTLFTQCSAKHQEVIGASKGHNQPIDSQFSARYYFSNNPNRNNEEAILLPGKRKYLALCAWCLTETPLEKELSVSACSLGRDKTLAHREELDGEYRTVEPIDRRCLAFLQLAHCTIKPFTLQSQARWLWAALEHDDELVPKELEEKLASIDLAYAMRRINANIAAASTVAAKDAELAALKAAKDAELAALKAEMAALEAEAAKAGRACANFQNQFNEATAARQRAEVGAAAAAAAAAADGYSAGAADGHSAGVIYALAQINGAPTVSCCYNCGIALLPGCSHCCACAAPQSLASP